MTYRLNLAGQWFRSRNCPRVFTHVTTNHTVYHGTVVLPHPVPLPEGSYGEMSTSVFLKLRRRADHDASLQITQRRYWR